MKLNYFEKLANVHHCATRPFSPGTVRARGVNALTGFHLYAEFFLAVTSTRAK